MKKVKKALKELGFIEKQKYFQHIDCPWFIKFVSPPVAIGNEPIQKFSNVKTSLGIIKMLQPVDSVKDRLANFYHWNDLQSLDQALKICIEQKVNLEELEKWSINENQKEKFDLFKNQLEKL